MRQARYRFFLLPLFLLLACAGAFAQADSEITGIVTDQTGAVVAGAKIALTDQATGTVHSTVSGSTGLYDIAGLNPSNYNLKATAKGFEAFAQTGIVVNISGTFRVDVKLTIGAETQTVTVEADALAVQADSNVISTLITSEDISELATENRNFSSLAALGLGVTNNLPDSNAVAAVSSSWSISFNGLSQAHNVWLIDGGESYDRGSGGKSALQPSQDALAEFNVLASNYTPDYGISTGGLISMALKSGTNKFHATAWEENRNRDYNANYFFNKQNTPVSPRPNTPYNIYGFNIGGPLFIPKVYNESKQKTFFFWNEEWRRTSGVGGTNNPTIDPADIPTAGTNLAYVTPKFAKSPIQLIVPTTATDPAYVAKLAALKLTPGQAFPGNVIPSALFDSNAVAYFHTGILPAPTTSNDFAVANVPLPSKAREDLVRIDHNFNSKWSLMGHWIGESLNTAAAGPFLGWTSYSYNTITSQLDSPSNSAVIKLTGAITPNLLVEASMNYDGNMLAFADSANANKPSGWSVNPVTAAFPLTQRTVVPGINGFGAPYNTSEDTSTSPYSNAARGYEPKLDISYTMGKHNMKYGFSYMRYTKKQILGGDSQGLYAFGALSGDGMMDMLMGLPTNYQQAQATPILHWFNQTPSVYAMDNWHVTPRLSLQIGLRYDAMPHTVERSNSMSNFVPNNYLSGAAPVWNANGTIETTGPGVTMVGGVPFYLNGMVIAGQEGTPKGLVNNDYFTAQPRVGFSEDLFGNGRTVLRGGFGIFYERIAGNDELDISSPPFSNNLSLNNTYFTNPGTNWTSGAVVSPTTLPVFANGLTTLATTYKAPGSAMYSLGVQREVLPSLIWVVQYVGNIDWHQNIVNNINTDPLSSTNQQEVGDPNCLYKAVACTPAPAGFNANAYRTYPGFTGIQQEQNTNTGDYNSFQTGLRIQNKWGLSGEADYTWSHQIDTTANGSQDLTTSQNPWNQKYDKGSGVLDRRQQLNVNYVYKLPFFNKDQGVVRAIAGGWELAGTFVANTGLVNIPGVNLSYDPVGLGGGYTNRPNVTGKLSYPKQQKQWFNTAQFTGAKNGGYPVPVWAGGSNLGFGNAGKDAIVGPGRVNFSTSLYKSFVFAERYNFQLRFESFNTFNHTEFSSISSSLGSGNFGQATNTWDPRALELGGRFSF
jgi:hypothetical protein